MRVVAKPDGVKLPGLPAELTLKSETWYEWLEKNRTFRYESNGKNIGLIKDKRGYWTAQKKISGKLRRKRLGVSFSITLQKLESAINLLCDDSNWNNRNEFN